MRGALDSRRLLEVDVVALGERLDRAVADVLVVDASEQVVDHAFAQRSARRIHALDRQALEDRGQDRDAARERRAPLVGQPVELEALRRARVDQRTPQTLQSLRGDPALRPAVLLQDLRDRQDRAGRTDTGVPAEVQESTLDRSHLEQRRDERLVEGLLRHVAAPEEPPRVRHAAHEQAVRLLRLEAFTEDALGRAAANVHDEPTPGIVGEIVRDAEVREARFLLARDDLDRVTERLLRLRDESAAVADLPHRVRADRAHRAVLQVAQSLPETLETRERARLRLRVEPPVFVEPVRQHDQLAQFVDDVDAPADDLRDEHVETVRPEVDGGDVLERARVHARRQANSGGGRKGCVRPRPVRIVARRLLAPLDHARSRSTHSATEEAIDVTCAISSRRSSSTRSIAGRVSTAPAI